MYIRDLIGRVEFGLTCRPSRSTVCDLFSPRCATYSVACLKRRFQHVPCLNVLLSPLTMRRFSGVPAVYRQYPCIRVFCTARGEFLARVSYLPIGASLFHRLLVGDELSMLSSGRRRRVDERVVFHLTLMCA